MIIYNRKSSIQFYSGEELPSNKPPVMMRQMSVSIKVELVPKCSNVHSQRNLYPVAVEIVEPYMISQSHIFQTPAGATVVVEAELEQQQQ